jgi:hypothetical protein
LDARPATCSIREIEDFAGADAKYSNCMGSILIIEFVDLAYLSRKIFYKEEAQH